MLFGSDWPHSEGTERPADYIDYLGAFSETDKRKILRDNALGLMKAA